MLEKLIPVYGDITTKRLGLNDEQYRRVISSANVVFHMAASLKVRSIKRLTSDRLNVLAGLTYRAFVCMCLTYHADANNLYTLSSNSA